MNTIMRVRECLKDALKETREALDDRNLTVEDFSKANITIIDLESDLDKIEEAIKVCKKYI